MGSFGSSEQNVESWKIHRRLTGHESDVVDIAWSADPDDSYLATVGLDAVINIWSGPSQDGSRGGFERVRRIAGHDGFVKGVVWDPRGNYLATQSDDKTLKIWRTSDWSCAKVVTEPFQHSPSSNFFGRPSWSPDGGYIIAANAMSGPVFVASVIERKTWATDLKLVGHEDSVVVCAFSPRLFKLHGSRPDSAPATIVAIGSRDQSISIWITGIDKPLLVLKDVFDRQVTDLAW
jgi:protein HIRA/HIR1